MLVFLFVAGVCLASCFVADHDCSDAGVCVVLVVVLGAVVVVLVMVVVAEVVMFLSVPTQ